MSSEVTVVDLAYLAPVPVGHEVLVLHLTRKNAGFFDIEQAECVIDQATRILYGDRSYMTVLEQVSGASALPADSPADALGEGWSVAKSLSGQVVGAVMGTTDAMKTNYARTRLYLRTGPGDAYR